MERIFEYQITAAEEGRKIGDFLREKGYSRHLLRQLKETEDSPRETLQPTLYDSSVKGRRPDPGPSSGKSRRERGDHARSPSF